MRLLIEDNLKSLLKMKNMLNLKKLECGQWNLIIHGIIGNLKKNNTKYYLLSVLFDKPSTTIDKKRIIVKS